MTKKAFMTIQIGSEELGRLDLVLYDDTVPRTVQNFVGLFERYKGSSFHRIIPKFMAQGGDFENGNGTGGESIYGKTFADENFQHGHSGRGVLSMANSGPATNGSQFFITFRPTPHLDGKHVVFGHVDMDSQNSAGVLEAMEKIRTDKNDVPRVPIIISDCGLVKGRDKLHTNQDGDQIDLDAEDRHEEDGEQSHQKQVARASPQPQDDEIELPEDEEDDAAPKTKSQALRDRLKKLKMKMNQARQLNRQEVMREGERLGSVEGMAKERKRQAAHDKKLRVKEWESRNAKALEAAAEAGIDGKFMVEPAVDSMNKATRTAEKADINRYGVKDYHNPEGQYRNYERNIKSIPAHAALERASGTSTDTFNPMVAAAMTGKEEDEERKGARRLANELKKRIEKKAKKRDRLEFDAEDVSYINQRNKRFNEKISRTYDKQTAEIRQNLERGTAL